MSLTILEGHVLDRLQEMEAESVQCCITSPPYWSLRDYKTAPQVWGGETLCPHEWGPEEKGGEGYQSGGKRKWQHGATRAEEPEKWAQVTGQGAFCQRCGAWMGHLGLEPTPEMYVQHIVEIFREVRRVLRKDGTLWLNMGSSFASGGMRPSPSPLLWRAPAYDSGGTKSPDSQCADRVCSDSDGEPQGAIRNHRVRNAHSGQSAGQDERLTSRKGHDNERSDCGQAFPDASLPGEQVSTTPQSFGQPADASCHEARAWASPTERPTSSASSPRYDDRSACTFGTFPKSPPLVVHTLGKESFFSACGRSDCMGVGRCGLCWCSLAIPSLTFKGKDLVSIPELVAFALQADGWWLRSDIIWAKPNPMPESVTDRPTRSHEYLFLLAKSERYYYDAKAIAEPVAESSIARISQTTFDTQTGGEKDYGEGSNRSARKALENFAKRSWRGSTFDAGKTGEMKHTRGGRKPRTDKQGALGKRTHDGCNERWDKAEADGSAPALRNKRDVWTIPVKPFPLAHFATFPPKLVEPCVLAGSRRGDMVFDPFMGAGTTGLVALWYGRRFVGIELNPEYIEMARRRITEGATMEMVPAEPVDDQGPLFAEGDK